MDCLGEEALAGVLDGREQQKNWYNMQQIKLRQGGEGRGGDATALRLGGGDVGGEGGNGGGLSHQGRGVGR